MAATVIKKPQKPVSCISKAKSSSRWLRWLTHDGMYNEERLRPLLTYRYQGVDKSLISRFVLYYYWNWAVTLFPRWMAPNLITLLGFAFMVLALVLGSIFIPDLIGPGPSWIYFFFAICIWIYSTFDNVDGKQARRTGSSSPLGELFDHGCDALNCGIGGLVQIMSMGLGCGPLAVFAMLLTFWGFYLPTWEEYHTGVLYLGYVNGPTEGLLFAMAVMTISGIYGPEIWSKSIGTIFPRQFNNTIVENLQLTHLVVILFLTIFLFVLAPTSFYAVHQAIQGKKQQKKQDFVTSVGQIAPMVAVTGAALAWLYSPYSQILSNHFILFWLTFGVGFGKMATKIIYAHLTQRKFPMHSGLMIPLFVGAGLINLPRLGLPPLLSSRGETLYLWSWLAIALFGYITWSYHLIQSFCLFLGIRCFSITALNHQPLNIQKTAQKTE